jgi:hypothetical protein
VIVAVAARSLLRERQAESPSPIAKLASNNPTFFMPSPIPTQPSGFLPRLQPDSRRISMPG